MRHNADVTISESGGLLPRLGPYWSFPRCWAQEPPRFLLGFLSAHASYLFYRRSPKGLQNMGWSLFCK